MNEDFLHYIWKFQQFNPKNLETTSGEKLEVIKTGFHNLNSGPDFFNGQIRLNTIRWAGNIEIHTKSSDWKLHKHQEDAVYDKVILHVVWENNQPVFRNNGDEIPTLELKGLVQKRLLNRYRELNQSKAWIPCEEEISGINPILKRQLIDQKLVERLQAKADRIEQVFATLKNDWEATFFHLLAKYFGFKVNAVPFEILATSLPFHLVRKHQGNEKQLSALFFGQAGFLDEDFKEKYPKELKQEYRFLKKKFGLTAIDKSMWKFMRLRPANFPTIRIAQLVACLHQNKNLFQKILETNKVAQLKNILGAEVNIYWKSHFQFDKLSQQTKDKRIGNDSLDILIINVIVPLLFTYGRHTAQEKFQEIALRYLQELKPEKNKITKRWKGLNMPLDTAYESQSLIQLKTQHCDLKNCLLCSIGNYILKKPNE